MKRAATILALVVVSALPLLAQLPPSRFERRAEVAAPGWYRVELDPAARGHMMPDARDVRLLGPSGEEIPFLMLSRREGIAPLPATALQVAPVPGGWSLEFDLGGEAPRHSAFRFEFANQAAVSGCRLEASADRSQWRPLATGDLFRLGEGSGLSKSELAYEACVERYLRLFWPQAAGYPEVRRAEALPAPASPATLLEATLSLTHAGTLPGGQAYLLSLPGTGLRLRGLRIEIADGGAFSYRLFLSREGRWEKVAEDALAPDAEGRATIPCNLETGSSAFLRVEVATGTALVPKLARAWGSFEADRVIFHAPQPGSYRLAYGSVGVAPPAYPKFIPPQASETLPALLFGEEREGAAAGLPAARAALGAGMPELSFSAAWSVVSPAKPGSVVRLEIPAELYASARRDLGDLRLESGGRQLPYVLHSPAEPLLVGEWVALAPSPTRNAGESEVLLPPLPKGLPVTALELRTTASAFQRAYTIRASGEAARPGLDTAGAFYAGTWSCSGASALPCAETVPLSYGGEGELRILFRDGENPPLPPVTASLWRRRHQLLYLQPESPVRLVAGSPSLTAPSYDIAALGEQLLATSFTEATTAAVTPESASSALRTKGLLLGALALCGGVLLWVLAKALRGAKTE